MRRSDCNQSLFRSAYQRCEDSVLLPDCYKAPVTRPPSKAACILPHWQQGSHFKGVIVGYGSCTDKYKGLSYTMGALESDSAENTSHAEPRHIERRYSFKFAWLALIVLWYRCGTQVVDILKACLGIPIIVIKLLWSQYGERIEAILFDQGQEHGVSCIFAGYYPHSNLAGGGSPHPGGYLGIAPPTIFIISKLCKVRWLQPKLECA